MHIHSYVSGDKIFNLGKTEAADVDNEIKLISEWPTATVLTNH